MVFQIHMINTRGRPVLIDDNLVESYKAKGWRVIINPTETYYPQYDQSNGTYMTQVTRDIENGDKDMLKVEIL